MEGQRVQRDRDRGQRTGDLKDLEGRVLLENCKLQEWLSVCDEKENQNAAIALSLQSVQADAWIWGTHTPPISPQCSSHPLPSGKFYSTSNHCPLLRTSFAFGGGTKLSTSQEPSHTVGEMLYLFLLLTHCRCQVVSFLSLWHVVSFLSPHTLQVR